MEQCATVIIQSLEIPVFQDLHNGSEREAERPRIGDDIHACAIWPHKMVRDLLRGKRGKGVGKRGKGEKGSA
jgi:hypothetical protein